MTMKVTTVCNMGQVSESKIGRRRDNDKLIRHYDRIQILHDPDFWTVFTDVPQGGHSDFWTVLQTDVY